MFIMKFYDDVIRSSIVLLVGKNGNNRENMGIFGKIIEKMGKIGMRKLIIII